MKLVSKQPKKKRKVQFSKIVCIFGMILVFYVFTVDAALSVFRRELLGETTRTIITVFGAFCTGGYFTLQGVRDTSLNRHGIRVPEDGSGKYIMKDPNKSDESEGV